MNPKTMEFRGGPWHGQVDGPMAWLLRVHRPAFLCADSQGQWEHYVLRMQNDEPYYQYELPCSAIRNHPDCGHDHEGQGLGQAWAGAVQAEDDTIGGAGK